MENSNIQIKLVIKRKGFEVSTEGTTATLSKQLDSLAEFVDSVSERLELASEEEIIEPESPAVITPSEKVSTADIPVIKPSTGTPSNLKALFDTPWGRTPRGLAEVMKALEVNAAQDSVPTVSTSLRRLVKRGELRRIEKEGKWTYFKIPSSE